jgi:hypothetical protein
MNDRLNAKLSATRLTIELLILEPESYAAFVDSLVVGIHLS